MRSAPFDVAPEVARVHAGDVLTVNDQPQGGWRRVRLADGRYGFMRDSGSPNTPAEVVVQPAAPSSNEEKPPAASA